MIVGAAKAKEAAEVLGVELATLDAEALAAAYRAKAKAHHPDVGDYDPALWARISWAKAALGHWLASRPTTDPAEASKPTCRACGGKGRIDLAKRSFGKPVTVMCLMCGGTGQAATGGEHNPYQRGD